MRSPITSLQALKTEESKDKYDPGRKRHTARDNGNSCLRAFATGSSEEKGDAVSESRPSSSSSKRIVCLFYKDIVSRGDWLGKPANFKGACLCYGFYLIT